MFEIIALILWVFFGLCIFVSYVSESSDNISTLELVFNFIVAVTLGPVLVMLSAMRAFIGE